MHSPEALERARLREAERALDALWAVVGTTNRLGAEWEFRFWAQGGALTLLSFRLTEEGEGRVAPVGRGTFLPRLTRRLPTLLGTQPREVTLTLEREEAGWSVDMDTASGESPPQARLHPSTRAGNSAQAYQQVLGLARGIARRIEVAHGGHTRLTLWVSLEDTRVEAWEPKEADTSGRGSALHASEAEVTLIVGALLPFTSGTGERTVALVLEGKHPYGEARPHWRVLEARTLEPAPPPKAVADIHQEYKALKEYILFEFQEQTREQALLAAGFTLEQIAFAIVGGFLIKRVLVLIEVAAPTVTSFLVQGGKASARWFRNLLVRMSSRDRDLLLQLWTKAETQGLKALTAAEKQQLSALMGRMEATLGKPLDGYSKSRLWKWARQEYFELHNPGLAKLIGPEDLRFYHVHHKYPMEYAQLFPSLDINGKANLAGVHVNVHSSITAVWNSLGGASQRMRPRDVERMVDIVDRHFGRWFDKVYNPRDAARLAEAQRASLREVIELKESLIP